MLLAVLTISDRCSQGLLTDTAGPAVVGLLRECWPAAEIWTGLLADDEDAIAATLEKLSQQGAALVLTVGGTGMGPRDRTPEATRRVIDREAPGLAEAMRLNGAQRNPFAWLSRPQREHDHRQPAGEPARSRREPGFHSDPRQARDRSCRRRAIPSVNRITWRFLFNRRRQLRETLSNLRYPRLFGLQVPAEPRGEVPS